jgi:hypothetical protein
MAGWVIARDAVIVATPAWAATSARVVRPLARPFALGVFVIAASVDFDNVIMPPQAPCPVSWSPMQAGNLELEFDYGK